MRVRNLFGFLVPRRRTLLTIGTTLLRSIGRGRQRFLPPCVYVENTERRTHAPTVGADLHGAPMNPVPKIAQETPWTIARSVTVSGAVERTAITGAAEEYRIDALPSGTYSAKGP